MISEIPWLALIAALAVLLALFVAVKGLRMPSSFRENQQKRVELRRKNAIDRENSDKK